MRHNNTKRFVLLFGFFLSTVWCGAISTYSNDDYSHITIKESSVQGTPKASSIDATIDGHYLTVVFSENLGTVQIEITDLNGGTVALTDFHTPNGYIAYIYNTGSYIVTFTLSNGDVYYGEFDVTD